jgi:hypothetical protein
MRNNARNMDAKKNVNDDTNFDEAFYRVKQSILNRINFIIAQEESVSIFDKAYRKDWINRIDSA